MKSLLHDRRDWPFPTMLPYSIKMYPIVQTAPRIRPPRAGRWPLPASRSYQRWSERSLTAPPLNQIYVHVPFCPFFCHFCPLYKVPSPSSQNSDLKVHYVESLLREIRMYAQRPDLGELTFDSVYFGGGTPTELSPRQLQRILTALRDSFSILPNAEITLEGVARQMAQPDYLGAAFAAGFNRLSFGAQSLDPEVRRYVGRGDQVEDYPALIELSRSLDPAVPVNLEIMAGQPGQSYESLVRDVQQLISWAPDSIDTLYYVMMLGTRLARRIDENAGPPPASGDQLLSMREYINAALPRAGYHQLTAEAFSRTSDRDLFAAASFGGGDNGLNSMLALGPSAFGTLNGVSYHNLSDLALWSDALRSERFPVVRAQRMNASQAQMRGLLLSLVKLQIPKPLAECAPVARRAVRRWQDNGLVLDDGDRYTLTPRGKLWYNHMQMDVLPMGDRARSLRMFGSIAKQTAMIKKSFRDLRSHEREIWLQMHSEGQFKLSLYHLYLFLHRLLPFLDDRPIGFTGSTDAEMPREPSTTEPLRLMQIEGK